jgi:hypothetical protein
LKIEEPAPLSRGDRELLQLHMLEACDARAARYQQPEQSAEFGAMLVDPVTGELRSYASLLEPAVKAGAQLELNLTHYAKRAEIRRMLAEKIEREVLPIMPLPWIAKIPDKLRQARKTGTFGVHAMSGRGVVLWDDKASLSRLCPDDAREEAARLEKRYIDLVTEQWKQGCDVYYSVFTVPNVERGKLGHGMKKIYERFRRLVKKPDGKREAKMPEIEGALCVLEAPLSAGRDWNVHLNALLIARGFVDYGKVRELWHWNVEIKRLPRGDLEALRGAFREVIKYAVLAVAEKSSDKAHAGQADQNSMAQSAIEADPAAGYETAAGEPCLDGVDGLTAEPGAPWEAKRRPAPPMMAWSAGELCEWLLAFHGFRRTRSYGSLYGAPKPAPAALEEFVWVGYVRLQAGAYRLKLRLLDSIPEDKSPTATALEKWHRWRAMLKPGPAPGAELDGMPLDHFAHAGT